LARTSHSTTRVPDALKIRDDLIQRRQPGRVHERHAAHANDDRAHPVLAAPQCLLQILGRAEEERPVDAVDDVSRRQHEVRAEARIRRDAAIASSPRY
jgi:hypothetical protein